MPRPRSDIGRLIREVMERPFRGTAGKQLAAHGAAAVRPVLKAMAGPYPQGPHPRDVIEALADVLGRVAAHDPKPLLGYLRRTGENSDDRLMLVVSAVSALANGPVDRVQDALIRASRHRNQYVRFAAVEALIRFRTPTAVGSVVNALRDRSDPVRMSALEAMKRDTFFRRPEAAEPLRRILRNQNIRRHGPGMIRLAEEVLRKLEAGAPRP